MKPDIPATAPATHAPPSTATILLVDDEPVSRLSMAARLKRMGLRVLEASNGKDGLEILRRERPDLTILDWIIPEMDGPTVCEQEIGRAHV